jgi:DNA-binding transcriptional regulator YiaG
MPNFAIALKEEIRRLARREIKQHTGATKKALMQCRKEIAKLRRLLNDQHKQHAFSGSSASNGHSTSADGDGPDDLTQGLRFSSRSVRAQRRRLGLSADEYAKLLGVSALTIYNWEHGRTRPREAQVGRLAGLRNISKREAMEKLGTMEAVPMIRKPR